MEGSSPHATTQAVSPPVDPTTTINATGSPSVSASRSLLARGASIGRYVILDKIGVGGMGVVYSAYDPELDRKLAVKLLTATDDVTSVRRRRLLREAQAMARLTHPNVITVHDVGTVDEQIFVAMEFIDGATLRKQLTSQTPWTEVVDVFIAAGQGLSAAHEAGLVHRDFKPDNVMVAKDGRVVVMDFGLARAADPEDGTSPGESGVLLGRGSLAPTGLEATVTAAGAVMGTPAYMSPEQHEARDTDARSDQFAFCVALYEALYGQRPFKGAELTALAVNVCCGNVLDPPAGTAVPSWLRATVTRGLAVDPDERHPSMAALLGELQAERAVWRRRLVPVVGVAAVAGIGLAAGLWIDTEQRPCEHADGQLDAVWSSARAEQLEQAFTATGLAFAPETWPAVRSGVDSYVSALSTAYTDACEATHVRREQSTTLLDRRVSCLGRGQAELVALLDLLAAGDPIAVEHALTAVQELPPAEHCGDVQRLTDAVPPPSEAQAERVQALSDELAQVRAMSHAGLVTAGYTKAKALAAKVREVGYAPQHARAVLLLAGFERELSDDVVAERSYREALAVALRGKDDEVAALAAVGLVAAVGDRSEGADDAEGWAELAAALLGRSGSDPGTEAKLLAFRASILWRSGRLREARDALTRALAQTERAFGPGDVRVADATAELADVLVAIGERHRARQLYERALKIDEQTVGKDHPNSATILHALGDLSLASGAFGPALDYHLRGLAIREAVRGQDGVELIDSLRALGLAYAALGRTAIAEQHLARAITVAEARLGKAHPVTLGVLADLADARLRGGDGPGAVALLTQALSRQRAGDSSGQQAEAEAGRLEAVMGLRAQPGPDPQALRDALTRAQATLPTPDSMPDVPSTDEVAPHGPSSPKG